MGTPLEPPLGGDFWGEEEKEEEEADELEVVFPQQRVERRLIVASLPLVPFIPRVRDWCAHSSVFTQLDHGLFVGYGTVCGTDYWKAFFRGSCLFFSTFRFA